MSKLPEVKRFRAALQEVAQSIVALRQSSDPWVKGYYTRDRDWIEWQERHLINFAWMESGPNTDRRD